MIALALKQQYTNITIGPDATYECVIHDGQIVHWSRPEPQPAVAEVLALYDPVLNAQSVATTAIKSAGATARGRYVTTAPGKDAEYRAKQQEVVDYDDDQTVGVFMQARMDATGETAVEVADLWRARTIACLAAGSSIAAIEDKALIDLEAATTVEEVDAIQAAAEAVLEGL